MKKLIAAALMCVALAGVAFAQRPEFDIQKIVPAIVQTPEYAFTPSGPEQKRPPGRPGQWLQVEVEFESRAEVTDELTVRYFFKIAGQCLTGEVTHINVLAGRDLRSVMYIAPNTATRLLAGKPLTQNSLDDVGIQLVRKGQVVAIKSLKTPGITQWWQNMQQTSGLAINKNETPFAPLYWDRYEAIKSASHQ